VSKQNIAIRSDPKHVEQMAQSIADVLEVARETKTDQANIAIALKLLGAAHEESWVTPDEPPAS
jgi:hypothetical protein